MIHKPLREAAFGIVDPYDMVDVVDVLNDEVSGRWESEDGSLMVVAAGEIKPSIIATSQVLAFSY